MTRPWAVVRSEQWAIAWQLDGLATVRDLAWRNGYALYDTLELVGDLVQAGLCTVSPPVAVAVPVTALLAATEPPAVTELPLIAARRAPSRRSASSRCAPARRAPSRRSASSRCASGR
jgi:hypothetical protein